ncbi:DDE-type integrase/transposase/recombinase [Salmonella enterica subsp. enterica serovar Minnesota]|uniref:Mu transposase C-terminal domain-containing protein n=1 Tax=Salmonella enterica TaxID=28901 RepID=UPI000FA7BDF0|nr:transposase [Salmonella enterica subsp. enterica serovar Minnesota]EBL6420103.1 DDE-type integrase/transposase/recombinase [Salmonella enterica subsp. enterica serovar Give]EHK1103488.1 transposase [Salmonella enterica]EAP3751507.1 transposase [Salmonella enterica subsp. enterica serovar Minnesota]EAP3774810.1 transposase [Salmonella enterica subsp. enterica serovar Minnesota]
MFFSVNDLTGVPGLPGTVQGIRWTLNRVTEQNPGWRRKRAGSKAFEYHIDCLPAEAQKVLRDRLAKQLLDDASVPAVVDGKASKNLAVRQSLEVMVKCPELALREVQSLTDKQKAIADARILLAAEVHKLRNFGGMTRTAAVKYIVEGVRQKALSDRVMAAAAVANARRGNRVGISTGALQEWYSSFLLTQGDPLKLQALLAPGHHKEVPWEQIPWLNDFFMFYRTWKRPTIADAYEQFAAWWQSAYSGNTAMLSALPSVYAVTRALRKVPVIVKERFRSTGSAWRSLNPFVRRDWTTLPVNAVWVGDGHCMKMTALNPMGNIFHPEITLIMDAGQRFIVGWSLALSESTVAVADALRHGMMQHGIPLIYYSDNGGGEKNRNLDADITGILPRLGVEHHTGIPGNPQGRGIIERVNKEIPRDVARSFRTYCAKNADAETVRLQQRIVNSALTAAHKGKDLTKRQAEAIGKIPTWEQLLTAIEQEVARYNNRQHSSLPRRENGKHYSPAAYRRMLIKEQNAEIDYLSPDELHEMFRPEIVRTTSRGEVRLFNNIYFAHELAAESGNEVRVSYDIHDANSVIVRRMDGSFICDAVWNGNRVDAFAKPVIQKLQEQRVKGRIARAMETINDASRELKPAIEHKEDPYLTDLLLRAEKEAEAIRLMDAGETDVPKNGTYHK